MTPIILLFALQLNPTVAIDSVEQDTTWLTISWQSPASPPAHFTILYRDSTNQILQECFTGMFISPAHCAFEPIPGGVTAFQTRIKTPTDSLALHGWIRAENNLANPEISPTVWLYAYAPPVNPPVTPSGVMPDSTSWGLLYFGMRQMLDWAADRGYRANLGHADDQTVNWGSRSAAAAHCRSSGARLTRTETDADDESSTAMLTCYGAHLGPLLHNRNIRLAAGLIGSWVHE
jgi:hypothetical protein